MDGRKVVIILFALVAAVGIVTFVLYLLTRQLEEDSGSTGEFVPNAIVRSYPLSDTPALARATPRTTGVEDGTP